MRLLCAALPFLLAACAPKPVPAPEFAQAAAGWTLGRVDASDPAAAPESLRKLGVRQVRKAAYSGPSEIAVTLYEMASEPASLEAIQTWRAVPDTFVLHRDRHFAVVEARGADHDRLQAFLKDLNNRLAAP